MSAYDGQARIIGDDMVNLTQGRVQLPEAPAAEFLRPDTSDWVSTNQLTIIGQGSPPF